MQLYRTLCPCGPLLSAMQQRIDDNLRAAYTEKEKHCTYVFKQMWDLIKEKKKSTLLGQVYSSFFLCVKVRVFTYLIGREMTFAQNTKWIACNNKGQGSVCLCVCVCLVYP